MSINVLKCKIKLLMERRQFFILFLSYNIFYQEFYIRENFYTQYIAHEIFIKLLFIFMKRERRKNNTFETFTEILHSLTEYLAKLQFHCQRRRSKMLTVIVVQKI